MDAKEKTLLTWKALLPSSWRQPAPGLTWRTMVAATQMQTRVTSFGDGELPGVCASIAQLCSQALGHARCAAYGYRQGAVDPLQRQGQPASSRVRHQLEVQGEKLHCTTQIY
jgi:hypothetical protein